MNVLANPMASSSTLNNTYIIPTKGFPTGSVVKTLTAMQEMQKTQVRSLGQKDPLDEGMASHSSILAWKIPGTEESGWL